MPLFGFFIIRIALGLFRHATLMPVSAYKTSNVGLLGEFTFLLPFSVGPSFF